MAAMPVLVALLLQQILLAYGDGRPVRDGVLIYYCPRDSCLALASTNATSWPSVTCVSEEAPFRTVRPAVRPADKDFFQGSSLNLVPKPKVVDLILDSLYPPSLPPGSPPRQQDKTVRLPLVGANESTASDWPIARCCRSTPASSDGAVCPHLEGSWTGTGPNNRFDYSSGTELVDYNMFPDFPTEPPTFVRGINVAELADEIVNGTSGSCYALEIFSDLPLRACGIQSNETIPRRNGDSLNLYRYWLSPEAKAMKLVDQLASSLTSRYCLYPNTDIPDNDVSCNQTGSNGRLLPYCELDATSLPDVSSACDSTPECQAFTSDGKQAYLKHATGPRIASDSFSTFA